MGLGHGAVDDQDFDEAACVGGGVEHGGYRVQVLHKGAEVLCGLGLGGEHVHGEQVLVDGQVLGSLGQGVEQAPGVEHDGFEVNGTHHGGLEDVAHELGIEEVPKLGVGQAHVHIKHVHEPGEEQALEHVGPGQEHVGYEGGVLVGLLRGEGLLGGEVVHGWGLHGCAGHKGVIVVHGVQVLHS